MLKLGTQAIGSKPSARSTVMPCTVKATGRIGPGHAPYSLNKGQGSESRGQLEFPVRLDTYSSWNLVAAPPLGIQRAGQLPRTQSPSLLCTHGCTPVARRSAQGVGSHNSILHQPPSQHRCRTCRIGDGRPDLSSDRDLKLRPES